MRNLTLPEDLHEKCAVLLRLYDNTSTEWQLGKNKVKLSDSAYCGAGAYTKLRGQDLDRPAAEM